MGCTNTKFKFSLCKLSCTSSQALRVLYSVTVMPDYGWTLTVYGRQVDPNQCSLLCDVPMQLTSETLQSMLLLLHECNVCAGHSDPDFVRMAEARKGKLLSQSGDSVLCCNFSVKAFIEMAQALFHVAGVNYILSERELLEAAMIIPQSKISVRTQYRSGYKDRLLLLLSVEIVKDNRITTVSMMLHYQKDLEKQSNCYFNIFRLFKP